MTIFRIEQPKPTEQPSYPTTASPSGELPGFPTAPPPGFSTEQPGYPTFGPSTEKPGFPTAPPPIYTTEQPGYSTRPSGNKKFNKNLMIWLCTNNGYILCRLVFFYCTFVALS